MSQDNLIAEIADDKIRYIIYEHNEKSNYEILSKKILKNNGIKKGKILDFEYTSKKLMKTSKGLKKIQIKYLKIFL